MPRAQLSVPFFYSSVLFTSSVAASSSLSKRSFFKRWYMNATMRIKIPSVTNDRMRPSSVISQTSTPIIFTMVKPIKLNGNIKLNFPEGVKFEGLKNLNISSSQIDGGLVSFSQNDVVEIFQSNPEVENFVSSSPSPQQHR